MTASTPDHRFETSIDGSMPSGLLNLSRFTMDRNTVHSKPPCLPSPRSSAPSSSSNNNEEEEDDFPLLPMLAPRPPLKHRPRSTTSSGEAPSSLMEFVNLMSITDVAKSRTTTSASPFAPTQRNTFLLGAQGSSNTSTAAPELKEEEPFVTTTATSTEKKTDDDMAPPPPPATAAAAAAHWSFATPETMKKTISTPLALRASQLSQKRKSPMMMTLHSTPVDGNRPLMLPSLSTLGPTTSTTQPYHHQVPYQPSGRCAKKAKNYKTLLTNAPMLPSSPDLEDHNRVRMAAPPAAARRPFYPPCFSPPGGSVTLVNPNYRVPLSTPSPRAMPPPPAPAAVSAAAGLPTLDDDDLEEQEQSSDARKKTWIRMKRRTSLLCALRLAATES